MASLADLATLRLCKQAECVFTVINGVTDLKEILMAMANHIASMYPASGPSNVEECWGLGRSLMEQSSFTMGQSQFSSRRTGSRTIQLQEDRLQEDTAPGGQAQGGYSSRGTGSRPMQIQEDSDNQCCVYGG